MKTLIMLSAIPASGKTTWAKKYQDEHPNTFIISSDEVRMEVTHGDYQDFSKQDIVWKLFESRIHEYAKDNENCTVILDALNDSNEIRMKYLATTPEYDKKVLVLFPNTYERSSHYNGYREEAVRVPENVLVGLCNKFEMPNEQVKNIVDEIIEVRW